MMMLFGLVAIVTGCTAFTSNGIAVTSSLRLKGTVGKVVGTATILLGAFLMSLPLFLN